MEGEIWEFDMKSIILAATVAAIGLPAASAAAQTPSQTNREYQRDVNDARRDYRRDMRDADNRSERREAREEYREEIRDARQDRREDLRDWRRYRSYDYNRLEPGQQRYYADRYYRSSNYYQPRRLGYGERVYRGNDGRYYCRRDDGTTGLIVGGLAGGVIGHEVAPGDSQVLGTILGGAAGALLGRAIDREVTCH